VARITDHKTCIDVHNTWHQLQIILRFASSLLARRSVRIEQSANVIDHVVPSVGPHMWIRMRFGVVSGVGLGMGVLDFGGDRRRGRRGSLG